MRSISLMSQSMSEYVVAGLELIILKKLGSFPIGWYPTMVDPFSIILALIFGASY
jgi:hypothetical protein